MPETGQAPTSFRILSPGAKNFYVPRRIASRSSDVDFSRMEHECVLFQFYNTFNRGFWMAVSEDRKFVAIRDTDPEILRLARVLYKTHPMQWRVTVVDFLASGIQVTFTIDDLKSTITIPGICDHSDYTTLIYEAANQVIEKYLGNEFPTSAPQRFYVKFYEWFFACIELKLSPSFTPSRINRFEALCLEKKTLGEINTILESEGFSEITSGAGVVMLPTKQHKIHYNSKSFRREIIHWSDQMETYINQLHGPLV